MHAHACTHPHTSTHIHTHPHTLHPHPHTLHPHTCTHAHSHAHTRRASSLRERSTRASVPPSAWHRRSLDSYGDMHATASYYALPGTDVQHAATTRRLVVLLEGGSGAMGVENIPDV
eukprot:496806-Rhodomonas_salina.2